MYRPICLVLPLLPVLAWAGTAQTVVLDVQNMDCPVCRITLRKALEKVPGVSAAEVDYERKTTTVTYDPDRTTLDALTRATRDVGYPATLHRAGQP